MSEHEPSAITCPDCGDVLREEGTDWPGVRFRCHLGHTYTGRQLLLDHSQLVERLLAASRRTLLEHVALQRRLATLVRARGFSLAAERLETEASHVERRAAELVGLLQGPE